MKAKQHSPYGNWFSPISAELVASSSHNISQVKTDHGCVYWVEQFPEQKGRAAIICRDARGDIKELTPRDFSVRNRVHEYGGGDYLVKQGVIFFCNDRDQKLYCQDVNKAPSAITPDPDKPMGYRYADLIITPDNSQIICVRETHLEDNNVVNEIVAIATDGSMQVCVLVRGADFYAAPRLNFDASKLIYLRWNHPQMPWDGTELCVAEFMDGMELGDSEVIAGGKTESICQPSFDANGNIYFVSDKTNWWNLYKYCDGETDRLVMFDAEFAYPGWIFATSMYAIVNDDTVTCIVNEKGKHWMGLVQNYEIQKIKNDFDDFAPYIAVADEKIYAIAANAGCAPAVIQVEIKTQQVEVIHSSSSLMIDAGYFSIPEVIEFQSDNGQQSFANFYPPCNPHYQANPDELPPLIVISHGGPTACASTALNLKIQYWTSRGFAVVDVNYGGSTGYGRAYRDRLKGQWGVVDVVDCVNAAKYLVEQNKVDKARLIIKGSSAGGLTTLSALIFYDLFSAGASYYGVADLEGLVSDSHKFEAHYLETLVGDYPAEIDTYKNRSPLFHAELLTCPVIFFQGLEDTVVPPSQAESMMQALDAKNLPYGYITFPHEQHGFRDAKSIKIALEAELSFYSQIFDFAPADQVEKVHLKNF